MVRAVPMLASDCVEVVNTLINETLGNTPGHEPHNFARLPRPSCLSSFDPYGLKYVATESVFLAV